MLKVQTVIVKGKAFEGFAFFALTGEIQLILPWFRKASRFTSSLLSNPILTHAEVLP